MPELIPLRCHPDTPAPWVRGLAAGCSRTAEGGLRFRYRLTADPGCLRLPAPAPAVQSDGLWWHSCCEAFVAGASGSAYHEFNFSPSGAWAAYAFSGYRRGGVPLAAPTPGIRCEYRAEALALDAEVARDCLPPGVPWRVGLSVVLEHRDGSLSYWALHHAGERPDFHHPDSFTLKPGDP